MRTPVKKILPLIFLPPSFSSLPSLQILVSAFCFQLFRTYATAAPTLLTFKLLASVARPPAQAMSQRLFGLLVLVPSLKIQRLPWNDLRSAK